MVIERYDETAREAIYSRFCERGRMLPEGLRYVDSWVALGSGVCYQLMETDSAELFDLWIARWDDLVRFKVAPVVSSGEAASASGGS